MRATAPTLSTQSRYQTFLEDYVELKPTLETAANQGIVIDREYQEVWRGELADELVRLEAEIQEAVPVQYKPVKVYKKKPSVTLPFLYSSPKQIKAYIKGQGYKLNVVNDKETTDKGAMEALAKKHPKDRVLQLIQACRKTQKASVYLYEADADGRLRTRPSFLPSTGRLSYYSPNIQNIIKRGPYAKKCRRQFVASPGCVLVEMDYRAIEAIIAGYLADDQDYIRASKLGIHAILQSHLSGCPIDLTWPEARIRAEIKRLKKADSELYAKCKIIVYLSNYKGSAYKIKMDNPHYPPEKIGFQTVKEATDLQNFYYSTLGKKIKQWHRTTLYAAHHQKYLETPVGYRHYFHDIYSPQNGDLIEGTDAKRALAFQPQSIAAWRLKRSARNLAATGFLPYMRWLIHDAVLFDWPEKELKRLPEAKAIMEEPTQALGGISFEVETSIGKTWADMEEQ